MLVGGDVLEFEVKKEDCRDPPVDGSTWLDVGVAEHTFNVACVYSDNEVADADEVKARGTERAEKAIKL